MPGFHDGELAVQQQAGVRNQANRLSAMLAPPDLDGGGHRFLAAQQFAVITIGDAAGELWTSPLVGRPGFLDGHGTGLDVAALPRAGDPLERLVAGAQIGMVAIHFAARRRMRINGTIGSLTPRGFRIDVEQAYGNCPQYIHPRVLAPGEPAERSDATRATPSGYDGIVLTGDQIRMIAAADTFFLGTVHPTRGADASHRGGPAGFVHVEGDTLWWPDFPGNNMFNSLGNLAIDPSAALLFVDYPTGETLHLSGRAEIAWDAPEVTGRRVRFTPRHIVQPAAALPIHTVPS